MYEQRASDSPLVRCVWRAEGDEDGAFVDAATEYWGLGFTRHVDGTLAVQLIGPSEGPRPMDWFAGERYWGLDLEPHVFWRGLDKLETLGELRDLPVRDGFFELAAVRYPVPSFEEVETLVTALGHQGVLVAEPEVRAALAGVEPHVSARTLQRRFRGATGLGRKQVEQIRRARRAYALLQSGAPLADAAEEAGYADQSHMTRAFGVLAGRTPAEIVRDADLPGLSETF